MVIIHFSSLQSGLMDGVSAAVDSVARAEKGAGIDVTVLGSSTEAPKGATYNYHFWDNRTLSGLLANADVLHLHHPMHPRIARAALTAIRVRTPYVVSLHGSIQPGELTKSRWKGLKKRVYIQVVLKWLLRNSSALRALSSAEEEAIRRLAPDALINIIPNPVVIPRAPVTILDDGATGVLRLGYLGRFDSYHKGLDILFEIARIATLASRGTVEVHLAGKVQSRFASDLGALLRKYSGVSRLRVVLHGPLMGDEKWAFLRDLDAAVFPSRWEVFGISAVEASLYGCPTFVSESFDLVADGLDLPWFVLPQDPEDAADLIIERSGRLGRRAATDDGGGFGGFAPDVIADQMARLYRESIRVK